MEGKKSFLMYILVFLFIAIIVIFFVLPKSGEVMLECTFSTKLQNVNTTYNIKSKYVNSKFNEVNNDVIIDLSSNWIQRNEYKFTLEQDEKLYTDAGFTYEVSLDSENKQVMAKMYGDRETLNDDIIYFGEIDQVRSHFEREGYVCKEVTLK